MEKLDFNTKFKCDFCGCEEICAVTQYGTTHYNRLVCVECAVSINQNSKPMGHIPFDLNNSTIRFTFEEETNCDDEDLTI